MAALTFALSAPFWNIYSDPEPDWANASNETLRLRDQVLSESGDLFQNENIGRIITFKTTENIEFENVKLEGVNPSAIIISYINSYGTPRWEQIRFEVLPKQIQDFLGYDPDYERFWLFRKLEEYRKKEHDEKWRLALDEEAEKAREAARAAHERELEAMKMATAGNQEELDAEAAADLKVLETGAKTGNLEAQYVLGMAYYFGYLYVGKEENDKGRIKQDKLLGLAWIYSASYGGHSNATDLVQKEEALGDIASPFCKEAKELGKVFYSKYSE